MHYLWNDDQDDDKPDIGEYWRNGSDDEDREVLDPPDLAVRNASDADGGDGEEVEGGGAHDGAGAELVRLKVVPDDSDDGQHDLGSRRTWAKLM